MYGIDFVLCLNQNNRVCREKNPNTANKLKDERVLPYYFKPFYPDRYNAGFDQFNSQYDG